MQKFNSQLEAFLHWEKNIPGNIFFRQPLKGGKKLQITYQEAGDQIRPSSYRLEVP